MGGPHRLSRVRYFVSGLRGLGVAGWGRRDGGHGGHGGHGAHGAHGAHTILGRLTRTNKRWVVTRVGLTWVYGKLVCNTRRVDMGLWKACL